MKKAIIYGAGGNYIRFAGYLKERYEIVALVDGNENAWGSCCEGLEIEPPAVITDRQYDLVIVTPNDSTQIAGSLREKYAISEERIVSLEDIVLKEGRSDGIRICFVLFGGLGDAIISYNYIYAFYEHFREEGIKIDIANASGAFVQFVGNSDFVGKFTDKGFDRSEYDLVIELRRYPDIARADYYRIGRMAPKLADYLFRIRRFEISAPELIHFGPKNDGAGADREIKLGRTRFVQPDIDGLFGLTEEYLPTLTVQKELLSDIGLSENEYITVHRGCDRSFFSNDNVKLWEEDKYEELIRCLKKEFPDCKIVLLGEEYERSAMITSYDLDLLGKTDIPCLKAILKHAKLQIDTEGGLVHMRHALKGGTSVVLFGPTSDRFFGYSENINVRTDACPKPCEWKTMDWANKCANVESDHICMRSITPEMVIQQIISKIHNKKP